MLKQDLINELYTKVGGTKKGCADFLGAFQECIYEALAKGDEVKITGFGTFKTRKIAAHEGVDPRNGKKIKVGETVAPMFKVGSEFKKAVKV